MARAARVKVMRVMETFILLIWLVEDDCVGLDVGLMECELMVKSGGDMARDLELFIPLYYGSREIEVTLILLYCIATEILKIGVGYTRAALALSRVGLVERVEN